MWKGFKEDVDTPKVVRLQNKELFVLKTILISESCEKVIEVHDFIKGIEDEDYKKTNYISSPKFKLAGVDFSINVWPDNIANDGPGFISVFLRNHGGEDQTISMTVRLDSGVEGSWKMRKVSEFTRRVLEMAAVVITDLPAVTSPLGGFPKCKR